MKITSAFLVVIVAVCVTQGQKQGGKFPDLLAPFRGIFGRTTPGPGPNGQPHRGAVAQAQIGTKDLSGAATNKPYSGGPGPSASPAGEDDDGFRPSLFGSGGGGYEPGRGPVPHDSPQIGGGNGGGRPGGYQGGRGPPGPHHGRPHHGPNRPGTNRPTRQETGSAYGGFGPFGGLENGGGRPGGSSNAGFSAGDFGNFGADFGGFGDGPSSHGAPQGHGGFGGQGHPPTHGPSHAPQSHGPPSRGPPHHGPSAHGHGPHGNGPHGNGPHGSGPHGNGPHGNGPRPSHSPHHRGPPRFRGGPPGGHHGPQSSPSDSYNSPLGHHGGPGGPGGPRPGGHYSQGGPRPFHSSRPAPPEYSNSPGSHYNANEHPRPSDSPQGYFGPGGSDYPEQFDGGNRDTREPQIITADDVSRPGGGGGFVGPSFDDVYSSPQGAPVNFGPPSTNPSFGGGYSPASGSPGNPYGRQLNGFAPQDDSSSGLIRSNPLRPSTRPFNGFHSSSEESSPYVRQASGGKPFTFSRPLGASYQASNEDIHYGRPMLMSASGGNSRVARVPRAGRRKKIAATNSPHVVQLSSPKDPNFIRPSASSLDAVTAASDLNPAATGNGGNFHHGDDRILYHVAGHQGPYSYRFGYDTGKGSHNRQFRHEEKDGKGYVKGRYGFYDKSGKLNVINYQAHPEHGYHAERGHTHGHY